MNSHQTNYNFENVNAAPPSKKDTRLYFPILSDWLKLAKTADNIWQSKTVKAKCHAFYSDLKKTD